MRIFIVSEKIRHPLPARTAGCREAYYTGR